MRRAASMTRERNWGDSWSGLLYALETVVREMPSSAASDASVAGGRIRGGRSTPDTVTAVRHQTHQRVTAGRMLSEQFGTNAAPLPPPPRRGLPDPFRRQTGNVRKTFSRTLALTGRPP